MKKLIHRSLMPGLEIMVVDDTPANLRLLETMLRGQGCRVRSFPRGRLALAAAAKTPPNLILLDISMPEMDGYETCERFKADPSLSEIPIIFISARSETMDKVKAFGCGGVDYVTKPFQVEEVMARVAAHLGLREAQIQLKKSYNRLRELETLRDNVTQMIVHDLRTPLMVVAGYLDLAMKKTGGISSGGDRGKFLSNGRAALGQIQEMVGSILDVNRMESERMPLHAIPSDLAEIARDSLRRLRPLLHGRSVKLKKPTGKIRVVCDRNLIGRVLVNLLGNALKFTPSHSSIEVAVSKAPCGGRVEVSDTGPGIDAVSQARIFEKYYQAEMSHARHSTGLGLSFCKLAVEAHGGRIGVSSETRKRTTFWFELPRKAKAAPACQS